MFVCKMCGLKYTTKQSLLTHLKSKRTLIKNIDNPIVQAEIDDYEKQLQRILIDDKLQCKHCLKFFNNKYYRNTHEKKCDK